MMYNLVTVARHGQCMHCGAWRTDGKPPTVHFTRCALGPDGSQVGALRTDGGRWRAWRAHPDLAPAAAQRAAGLRSQQSRRNVTP